jgi:hypothetical protein
MKRYVSLEEISDGRLYTANDMVKADCGDCQGCSACCENMADTIILDPLDIHRLTCNLHCTFEALLAERIELGVVDGIILPHIKGTCCSFLDENGRCSIHDFRPDFCRLFPLGRYYEDRSFRYFLQTHECRKSNRTKIKVRKWIDTPDFERYETFVADWHYYLKDLQEELAAHSQDPSYAKQISMMVLQVFYQKPYEIDADFYEQFSRRLAAVTPA